MVYHQEQDALQGGSIEFMPTLDEHVKQFQKNISVVETLESLDNPPNDWIVVIAFYAALHLVEKKMLADHNQKFSRHSQRNKLIATQRTLEDISAEYDSLFMESCKYRYDCRTPSPGKLKIAKQNLQKIYEFCK
ncbi:MAG: hypothetical protein JWM44_4228 [Bacilli bacterium]|nr:hypothetical protein [Bacilli bacterium]